MHSLRILSRLLFVIILVCTGTLAVAAEEAADGTVSIKSTSVALGIGVQWGDGKLRLNDGSEYWFTIDGLSVLEIGIATVTAEGEVYHLESLDDFSGNYTAAEAGIAIGGGAGVLTMQNQLGVVMNLTSTQRGISLKLAAEGIKVQLRR